MIDHVEGRTKVDIHGIDILFSEVGIFYGTDGHSELPNRAMVCPETFLCVGEDIVVLYPVYGGGVEVSCPDFV